MLLCTLQEEMQGVQARAQEAESRAAVAEAELETLRKVRPKHCACQTTVSES